LLQRARWASSADDRADAESQLREAFSNDERSWWNTLTPSQQNTLSFTLALFADQQSNKNQQNEVEATPSRWSGPPSARVSSSSSSSSDALVNEQIEQDIADLKAINASLPREYREDSDSE
jgi:hypothetical protein